MYTIVLTDEEFDFIKTVFCKASAIAEEKYAFIEPYYNLLKSHMPKDAPPNTIEVIRNIHKLLHTVTPDLSKADDVVQAHASAVMAGSIDLRKNKVPTTDTVDESPQIKTTVLVSSKYYKDTILKIQELFTVLEPLITWGAISKGNLEHLRARVLDISMTK